MALILLALFIGLPLLEVAVFIQVGGAIGVWPTIAATIATALAGSLLLRAQGLATLMRARAQMDQGQLPAREMFEGVCLVLAGALLLVPGFVTDVVGLLLFIPPLRELLRLMIARYVDAKAARGEARVFVDGVEVRPGGQQRGGRGRGPVIDGDYQDLSPDDDKGDDDDQNGPDLRRIGR
ncbi:FxsA family protein [Pelagibius marinus]|uniref:FxsA family protein n=1 Tax=Pelagibius marinus TaxID=2762760 RepID=UPI0018728B30|nr:FxsA family protein [Pelagibius marinus]